MRAISGLLSCRKRCLSLVGNRVGHRQLLAEWVDVYAVDLELVVQVRAGGEAGGTDVADDLALLDVRTVAIPLAKPCMCPYRVR